MMKRVEEICNSYEPGKRDSKDQIRYYANELLELAKKEIIKDGYIIEKRAFHDAVEKIDDKRKTGMSVEYSLHCKVENGTRHAVMNWNEFQKVAQKFIDFGKAEALKDLPRWKKIKEVTTKRTEDGDCVTTEALLVKGWINSDDYRIIEPNCMVNREMLCIPVRLLYKLPGFNED